MKKFFNIMIFTLLVCSSCQERHPALFQDICGVYFRNLSPTMSVVDTTEITFVYESADEVEVPVRIQLLGRTASEDRKIRLEVRSENAQEGLDYELPQEAFIQIMSLHSSELLILRSIERRLNWNFLKMSFLTFLLLRSNRLRIQFLHLCTGSIFQICS